MTIWFHTTILATSLVATLAIGLASAAIYAETPSAAAPKTDRLPVATVTSASDYLTIETRADGMSVLSRVPVEKTASN